MPVGGRINRRDNLRSKKALTKSKVPEKNKQSNEINTGLNTIVDVKNKQKSEVIAKGFRNFYVCLEDFKLVEQDIFRNEIKVESPNKSPIKKNEQKKLTNNDENVVYENLYDTLKRKGRHNNNNRNKEVEIKSQVVEKPENNNNNTDTLKRRGRRKKEEIDIEEEEKCVVEEEKIVSGKKMTEVEATPKKRGRIAKKKEDLEELVTAKTEAEESKLKDENNITTKLTRKNAFHKEKIDIKPRIEKENSMEIDLNETVEPQNIKTRVRTGKIPKLIEENESSIIESNPRTGSRLSKNTKAFVVEKDEENESQIKIPGLVMLNNIRNRKSEMKLTKPNGSSKTNSQEENRKIIEDKVNSKEITTTKSVEILPEKIIAVTPITKTKTRIEKQKMGKIDEENVKVPGLRMTADIKRRKSELLGLPNENVTANQKSEKIPGLASGDNRKTTIDPEFPKVRISLMVNENELDKVEKNGGKESSISARTSINAPTQKSTGKSKIPMTSDKIPGLSTTSQLKKQKMEKIAAQKSTTLDRNFKINQNAAAKLTENHSDSNENQSEKAVDTPAKLKAATLDSSASIKFLSFKDQQKPMVGILAKPSPFKRPVSCLEASDDELDVKCKQSRIQVENRRQSVTFNRDVEVKEIHGNSFNSNPDESASGEDIMDRLRSELERTKSRVVEKRVQNVNPSYSHANEFLKEKQRNIGPSMFGPDLSRKSSSDLSNLISNRIKIQSNSPPRDQEVLVRSRFLPSNTADQPRSGALRKVLPQSISSIQKETPSNWKSFKQNPPNHQSNRTDNNNPANETLNDDSLSITETTDKKPGETTKSSCSVM